MGYMVFGESLINDGVAVVLYKMMNSFAGIMSIGETVTLTNCLMGLLSFCTIALGGLFIGITVGVITALITKFTQEVRVIEPLAVLSCAYLSYMLAELVSFSGIISLIGCGIVQAHYAFKNISDKSETTIKYFIAMLRFVLWKIFLRLMTHFSSTMDCIIFLYLGMAVLEAVQVPS